MTPVSEQEARTEKNRLILNILLYTTEKFNYQTLPLSAPTNEL